jgi:hypothetical protein
MRYKVKKGQKDFIFKSGLPAPEDYSIIAMPNWDTTVFQKEKSNKGFALGFGTACTTDNGWLDLTLVVPPHQMPEVIEQLPGAIRELTSYGFDEFHFADIYAGEGKFELDLNIRLAIFQFMAEIFKAYHFPIIVQTFDPDQLKELRSRGGLPNNIGVFNLRKQNDSALFFLLIRIKWYLEKYRQQPDIRANVFVDEGYKKDCVAISIPNWSSVFDKGLICFARSSTIYPIQLADFAAWSLNREQLILNKPSPTELDIKLLEILSPIVWNYVNIEKKIFSF